MERFLYIIAMLSASTIFAQNFHGGNADGHALATYTETQSIFAGGVADGFSTSSYTETQNIFAGGNADGFSTSGYTETQNIFAGGVADGFSTSGYTETQNIFAGGVADGFSTSGYTETQNIFAGGVADGFSTSGYTETQNIFAGGNADGFSVSNYNETQNIFAGGVADGFSMSLYDENPLCSDNVTVFGFSGWTNGVPDNTTQVVIDEFYQVGQEGDIDACSCLVKTGQTLQIEPNSYVKLEQDLVNNGTVQVMHQGSFVQVNNDATVTGSGTFTTELQTTQLDDPVRFTYFASPVQNQDLTVFSSWANMNRLWRFDEAVQDWYIVPSSTTMTPAVGYAIQGSPDTGQYPFIGYANFDGPFNNGIYSYPLTYNPGGIDDDNALVGNPYPSAIDAAQLLNNNASANAFYFWTHASGLLPDGSAYAGDDYAIWNSSGGTASGSGSPAPSGFIASGQGFFVDATAPGNLTFDNSYRVTGNNDDFRRPQTDTRDRIWVNMYNEYGVFNQILLNFTNEGTSEFDNKLDATRYFTGNAISFYSNGSNNERFAIQALPVLTDETIVPLGFEIVDETVATNLKIAIDHTDFYQDNVEVYLKDKVLGRIHNLSESAYEFEAAQDIFNDRFELIFSRNALQTPEQNLEQETVFISNYSDTEVKINSKYGTNIQNIVIYDVLGKRIFEKKTNQNSVILPLNVNEGTVLIFKMQLQNGKTVVKRFIKL